MIKWIKRGNNKSASMMMFLIETISRIYKNSPYDKSSYIDIRIEGHNQSFFRLLDELEVVYCVDDLGIEIRVDKLEFYKKISKKYPIIFSSLLVELMFESCLDEIGDFYKKKKSIYIKVQRGLLKDICSKDILIHRYSKEDMNNMYDIFKNIRFDIMAKVLYEKIIISDVGCTEDKNGYLEILSDFNNVKTYLRRYVEFIIKYKDEYPVVFENIECWDILLKLEDDFERRVLLDRLTDFYIVFWNGECEDSEYFYNVYNDENIALFEAKKRLMMMDSWECKFVYDKVNKLIWINENLGIEFSKDIKKEISFALCEDNLEFLLDDIMYSLVESFCKEYDISDKIRVCEFFDSLSLEEYNKISSPKEAKDVVYNAIINKHMYINNMFKKDMSGVLIMNTDDIINIRSMESIGFKKFESLWQNLKDINYKSGLTFDYVSDFVIYNPSSKSTRCAFAYNSVSKCLFIDMRDKKEIGSFEDYLKNLIDQNIVDEVIVWISKQSKIMNDFIYSKYELANSKNIYKIVKKQSNR